MAEIELNPDFRDFLHELSAAGAEFVLIGGWALAAHGYGRGPTSPGSSSTTCSRALDVAACAPGRFRVVAR